MGLPIGQVGHATATDSTGETYDDDYYFGDAGRWLRLRCETQERPGDAWRSIAESFEFLPTEE